MLRFRLGIVVAIVVAIGMVASPAVAVTIPLSAVQDTTIRNATGGTTTNYNNGTGPGISNLRVHRGTGATATLPSPGNTHAVIAFDLSGLKSLLGNPVSFTIVGAHLEYYQVASTSAGAHAHEVYLNNPADGVGMMNETTLTYSSYQTTYGAGQGESAAPITLGSLTLASGSANATYHVGGSAVAADLAYLNARASKPNAVDQFAQFLLWSIGNAGDTSANQSRRLFGDHENGNPVKLILDINVVPEPSAYLLASLGVVGLGLLRLKRRK